MNRPAGLLPIASAPGLLAIGSSHDLASYGPTGLAVRAPPRRIDDPTGDAWPPSRTPLCDARGAERELGFKFAVVGVLYAVLLAFAIIVVWEKFNDAENTVAGEAGATANVYRLSQGIGDVPESSLRAALSKYLTITISDDWPAMGHAARVLPARGALDAVYAAFLPSVAAE